MIDRKLNRLKGYDYSRQGCYFVTICVHERVEYLGEIKNGMVLLNPYGEIVRNQWLWLSEKYSYVGLDEFTVMPDHFHGILSIKNINVGNGRDRSLQYNIKSLSSLIGAFKTTSSKLIRQAGLTRFSWQKSFYDHIIRSKQDLKRIREYIRKNS